MVTLDSIRDIRLYQSKTGYRFSVDSLLLYTFVSLPRVKKIADIGAGSGIIGILLAKKYPLAEVILIEVQEGLVSLAQKNTLLNRLEGRVKVVRADAGGLWAEGSPADAAAAIPGSPHPLSEQAPGHGDSLQPGVCDLVVSNPPFRRPKTGLMSRGDEKAIARHEIRLSLPDLVRAASTLLRHHGRFCMIHLPERLTDIVDAMKQHTLELKRLRFVHSHRSSGAKMVLVEAVKGGRTGMKVERPLFIYREDGGYTEEIIAIYRD